MVLSVSDSTIKVYNAALTRIGVPKVNSFLETSIASRTGNVMFEDILEAGLCEYPWRFATRRVTLIRSGSTPPGEFEGMYTIPTSVRHVQKVYEDDVRSAKFEIFEREVAVNVTATDTTVVSVDGTVMVSPSEWPGYFRQAFIKYLAGEIAMPITQDERLAAGLQQAGAMALAKAASRDSQSRTPPRVDTKMFIRQRRSRRA